MIRRKAALLWSAAPMIVQSRYAPGCARHSPVACLVQAKHSPMRLAEAVENLLQKENVPFSKPVPGVLEIAA